MIQKFISKLSDRDKKILNIIVVLIIVMVIDWVVRSATDELALINQQIKTQKGSISRDLRILSYENKITQENEVFEKYFTSEASKEDDVNRKFYSLIQDLKTKHEVSVVKQSPSALKSEDDCIKFYADIDCIAPLDKMISFIHALNSTDELFKVVKYTMTPKRGASNNVSVTLTVERMIISNDLKPMVTLAAAK